MQSGRGNLDNFQTCADDDVMFMILGTKYRTSNGSTSADLNYFTLILKLETVIVITPRIYLQFGHIKIKYGLFILIEQQS